MLYVDKYRPKALSELQYHPELTEQLDALAASDDFPHVLFYGPTGAGKKTRIACLLKQLYGPGALKLKVDQRVFLNPSKRKIEVNLISSNYHIEITPRHVLALTLTSSDAGAYDRLIIQDILKEIAQTQQVDQNAARKFKIIVINEADSLSRDAQAALRRTMEKYMGNLRLILCANSTSRIIAPIRSRCLLLRVGAPSDADMSRVLRSVAKREKFHLGDDTALQVTQNAGGNMRKALLVLETLRVQSPDLSGPVSIAQPDWQTYCERTADMILSEQTPARLLAVRGRLYELLVHAIPASLIFQTLTDYLVKRVDDALRASIVEKAAYYELRSATGNKPIFHLEAFVVQVMYLQKSLLLGMDVEAFRDTLNPHVLEVEYAVRGEIPMRAAALEQDLENGTSKLPFDSIVWSNIGNPQQQPNLAQPPLTFWRQVAALTEYPALLDAPADIRDKLFPVDAQQRARELVEEVGSVGAYTGSKGISLVRKRVAEFVEKRDGYPEDFENIYLTAGASAAIATLFHIFFRQDIDGVLIPIPQYPLYTATLTLLGVEAIHYNLQGDHHWDPSLSDIQKCIKDARARDVCPRAIVIINPGNPTGACMPLSQIQDVIRVAYRENLVIFADEVYQANVYQTECPFVSFRKALLDMSKSSDPEERAMADSVELVSLHSISKGMSGECGRRGGYFELTNIDSEVEAQINKLVSVSLCPPVQGQIGVDLLVKPPQEGDPSYELWHKEYTHIFDTLKARSETMATSFSKLPGLTIEPAMGSMYLFPRLHLSKKAWEAAREKDKQVDEFYCRALLDETGICVVPGSGFGRMPEQLQDGSSYSYFRTTVLAKATDEFIARYGKFHRDFVQRYA
ncbi:alanine transaminase [Malassezia vespertilionis]|uniref:alanine transaminase n=1 Tax=Malassezia vespertilionis TaxID=2020962 RepID=UPI0024B16B71|nr:alanine transaminase [Malassezia vespertilionis]WFD08199.1 alanine transaminase [Malassezia vespertilionis]